MCRNSVQEEMMGYVELKMVAWKGFIGVGWIQVVWLHLEG